MYTLLILLSTILPTQGVPLEHLDLPPATSLPSTINLTSTPKIEIQFDKNYRSALNIVWSCLSVIFTCTWTALHPNVYGFQSTQWQRTKRRALLFLLAILMPEVLLVWSIKQWQGARDITRIMNGGDPRRESKVCTRYIPCPESFLMNRYRVPFPPL
jgi:hypothetical protein